MRRTGSLDRRATRDAHEHWSMLYLRLAVAFFCVACFGLGTDRVGADEVATAVELPPEAFYDSKVKPFVDQYCSACHSGDAPEAGLSLTSFDTRESVRDGAPVWRKVIEQLRFESMPPVDEEQPAKDERREVVEWLQDVGIAPDGDAPADPGRVTIRRLNRAEYNNTIRDLLGVELRPADDFPSDDVGYGFDNIGDVLSMPPVLLEKYLDAAEQVASAVIRTEDPHEPRVYHFDADAPEMDGGRLDDTARVLASRGKVLVPVNIPIEAEYAVRIGAYGRQAGPEVARMAVHVAGHRIEKIDVPAVSDAPDVYEVRTRVKPGERRVEAEFINDFYQPDVPEPEGGDRNLYIVFIEVEGPLDLEPAPLPESHRRIFYRAQAENETEQDYVRDLIAHFAARAFRRPPTDEEVARLVDLFELRRTDGATVEQAMQLAVMGVLVSPNFLFRIEEDRPANEPGGIAAPIDDYELATRLSYFLWSSMPDEELTAQAAAGRLHEPDVLAAEVRRILGNEKSRALVDNFADQWLQIRNLDRMAPDAKLFPEFNESLRTAMAEETRLAFEHVMREDRSVIELVSADYTFVNAQLAKHYGIEGVEGDEFRRVELADASRGGLLGQASILTITSNPTRTSPVKRGRWVLETLLGTPPPPPPANVPELAEGDQAALTGTLRERMEQHRSVAACATCHERLDPLGFGLENFDAVGRWRDRDGEFPIDASGELPSGEKFDGPAGLREIVLAHRDDFRRALSEKMLTYAIGRGLEYYDRTAVDAVTARLAEADDRFSELILAVVDSVPFRLRRAVEPAVDREADAAADATDATTDQLTAPAGATSAPPPAASEPTGETP